MEREPDIVALAARLGLRRLTYRTFARPVLASPVVVAKPDVPVVPAQDAPPPAPFAAAPSPVIAAAPPVIAAAAAASAPVPMPVAGAPAPRAVPEPAPYFPLLAQALAQGNAAAAFVPAAAEPFLNLRRAVAGPLDSPEH